MNIHFLSLPWDAVSPLLFGVEVGVAAHPMTYFPPVFVFLGSTSKGTSGCREEWYEKSTLTDKKCSYMTFKIYYIVLATNFFLALSDIE